MEDKLIIKVCRLIATEDYIEVDKLTPRQLEYINVIEQYKKENKKVPTIREICKMVGCNSTGTVFTALNVLSDKGYEYTTI